MSKANITKKRPLFGVDTSTKQSTLSFPVTKKPRIPKQLSIEIEDEENKQSGHVYVVDPGVTRLAQERAVSAITQLKEDYIHEASESKRKFEDIDGYVFMVTDADYVWTDRGSEEEQLATDVELQILDESLEAEKEVKLFRPVIRLFGTTETGQSVLCYVYGFRPYFYVRIPSDIDKQHCVAFVSTFSAELLAKLQKAWAIKKKKTHCDILLLQQTDMVSGRSLMKYEKDKSYFVKLTFRGPDSIPVARDLLVSGQICNRKMEVFEAGLLFPLRYGVDCNIYTGCWVQVEQKNVVRVRNKPTSYCDLELDAHYLKVHSLGHEGDFEMVAPIRMLSFDIECLGQNQHFPNPKTDSCIMIATTAIILNDAKERRIRVVHTVGLADENITDNSLDQKHVFHDLKSELSDEEKQIIVVPHATEEDMLSNWGSFCRLCSPDFLVGYNSKNFDSNYLYERLKILQPEGFCYLGKMRNEMWGCSSRFRQTSAKGVQKIVDVRIPGVVSFDVLPLIQELKRLPSYTLGKVSAQFLGHTKKDVHYSEIPHLQETSPQTRKRLAVYAWWDTLLPLQLTQKLLLALTYIEMTRITCTTLSRYLSSGQQMKCLTMIVREAKKNAFFVPWVPGSYEEGEDGANPPIENTAKYEGATVMKPVPGLYQRPIATLDFCSLYPSIIMAHNLCYSTYVPVTEVNPSLVPQGLCRSPNGEYFYDAKVREGILPKILTYLLTKRAAVKNRMKTNKDSALQQILDARQLGLKITANSIYGFTGAKQSVLPCPEVAMTVCAFGRQMWDITRKFVESTCVVAKGYPGNAKVIYGDTDSVMIDYGFEMKQKPGEDEAQARIAHRKQCMDLSKDLAALISKEFKAPIKLEFEKVYHPYLLLAPKKYSGLYYTKPEIHDKIDSKGIEVQKTDNCELIRILQAKALEIIHIEREPEKVKTLLRDTVKSLYRGDISYSHLILKKSIRRNMDDYKTLPPHIDLARRMAKKDPLNAPKENDSVYYIIVDGSKKSKVRDRAESVDTVVKDNLVASAEWYTENQIRKPFARILSILFPGEKGASEVKSLWSGEHTRQVHSQQTVTIGSKFGISKFCISIPTCANRSCRAKLNKKQIKSRAGFCDQCFDSDVRQKYIRDLEKKYDEARIARDQIRKTCETCKAQRYEDISCWNYLCDTFFERGKVHNNFAVMQSQWKQINDW